MKPNIRMFGEIPPQHRLLIGHQHKLQILTSEAQNLKASHLQQTVSEINFIFEKKQKTVKTFTDSGIHSLF